MGETKLLNCKKCKRLFSSKNGEVLCSRCNESIDDEFSIVKEYIYDNPSSSLKEVSNGTGVETEAILKWIREGKIILSEVSGIQFCERCGEPTTNGRFCATCVAELQNSLKIEDKGSDEDDSDKKYRGMYIKEKGEKKS